MTPSIPAATHDQTGLAAALLLVEIVELKWLLAGHGIWLHVERLQSDHEYARRVLAQAQGMPNAALRAAAERLRVGLGLADR